MTKLPQKIERTPGSLKLRALTKAERRGLAVLAETTLGTLNQLCYGNRMPGVALASRIEKATRGEITRRELRPDLDWDLILAAYPEAPQS